ncbi:MAG: nucleotidyltransferase domain-containing protein [Desulfuromonadaceae bacterium]|nr:nucleotidyltransferase domain-containing protein [Desulfuromonadaceae bacterium]MDD2734732.1 nucleotidyltransferase domain-containing protein [Desulfuromonadaceae bacterium]
MTKKVLDSLVQEIIGRILSVIKPTKVLLFGSAARGNMGANSDIDLLVVVPNGVHRRRTTQNIYRNMLGVGFAADIVVVTEEDIETYRDNKGFVIHPALIEGRIVYAA